MNSRTTGIWLVIAAALLAGIFAWQRHLHLSVTDSSNIFPGLRPAEVTSIQVIPADALEIRVDRAGKSWLLTKPLNYPAQPAAIEALLSALQKLTPAARISAAELRERPQADVDFGFNAPQISLVIQSGVQRWQLLVGNKTAPGDQVFLRMVGVDGAFVVDADWLKSIPHSVNDWRNTALVEADNAFDWVVLTNGAKIIELHRDATNQFWRMTRPLQARANSEHITDLLQRLRAAQVSRFISDDAKADLSAYGLQPADFDLWLGRGTNSVSALHAGKSLADDASQIYAKREGWNAVVTTAKDVLSPWHGTVNEFRDPHLLGLTAPVAEIEVRGQNSFTLQWQATNGWSIVGEKFQADAEGVQNFIKLLAGLRVAEFVKDVVTVPDWQAYGLAAPVREIILHSAAGDTNAVIAGLSFGTNQDSKIFVRRADEDFVYAMTTEDFNRLPESSWEFRERKIWNFSETNVVQITLHQNGKTRQIVRSGENKWSLAPGSQGIINPPAIEETAHRLGEMAAAGWVARGVAEPEKYGLNTNNLQMTFELKTGEKLSVDFGAELSNQSALAATTLDGERWAFIFSPVLYQFVLSYLTIPANVP